MRPVLATTVATLIEAVFEEKSPLSSGHWWACLLTVNIIDPWNVFEPDLKCPNAVGWYIGALLPFWILYPFLFAPLLRKSEAAAGSKGVLSACALVWAFPFVVGLIGVAAHLRWNKGAKTALLVTAATAPWVPGSNATVFDYLDKSPLLALEFPLILLIPFYAGATVSVLVRMHANWCEWSACPGGDADGGSTAEPWALAGKLKVDDPYLDDDWECGECAPLLRKADAASGESPMVKLQTLGAQQCRRQCLRLFSSVDVLRGLLADSAVVLWVCYMCLVPPTQCHAGMYTFSFGPLATVASTLLTSAFLYGSCAGGSAGFAARLLRFSGLTAFAPYCLAAYIFQDAVISAVHWVIVQAPPAPGLNATEIDEYTLGVVTGNAKNVFFMVALIWTVSAAYVELGERNMAGCLFA